MKVFIFMIALILTTSYGMQNVYAYESESDSIRCEMKNLEGEDLIQAHIELCRQASFGDNLENELDCIDDLLAEALRQKDVEAEGLARCSRIYCYYKYSLFDRLVEELPSNLKAMARNKTWSYYYYSWTALVEMYIYQRRYQVGLTEALKMYEDAKSSDNVYGIGVSAFGIGEIYQSMGKLEKAEKILEESIAYLSQGDDVTLVLAAYHTLCETLDSMQKYEKLGVIAASWRTFLDTYKEKVVTLGYTLSLNNRYMYCTLAAAMSKIGLGDYSEASRLLAQAEHFAEGGKDISRFKLLQIQSRYFAATKQYDKAIACNQENMRILNAVGDTVSLTAAEIMQADFLLKNGSFKESAELYHMILPYHEKLRKSEMSAVLGELNSVFEIDNLKMQNKVTMNRLFYVVVICILLVLLVVLYMVKARQLKTKNRALYDSILRTQNLPVPPDHVHLEEKSGNIQDKEELLYAKLCNLMQEEKLFTQFDLNRDLLAERLGTNRTYLAKAIKRFANGQTIAEFINGYRLKFAAALLTDDPSKNISEVELMAGFNSRATFSRLFKDQFGMTPSEYRNISKEKVIDAQ